MCQIMIMITNFYQKFLHFFISIYPCKWCWFDILNKDELLLNGTRNYSLPRKLSSPDHLFRKIPIAVDW